MEDLNTVIIEGRLTKEPELKYTSSGASVCNLSIANEPVVEDNNKIDAKSAEIIVLKDLNIFPLFLINL